MSHSRVLGLGSVVFVHGTGAKEKASTPHRFVIVGDDAEKGDWLIVPICSFHAKADSTCAFDRKDCNNLVDHKSYAAYYMAKKVPKKTFKPEHRGQLPTALFEKIRIGINASSETERWFSDDYNRITNPKPKGKVLWSSDNLSTPPDADDED